MMGQPINTATPMSAKVAAGGSAEPATKRWATPRDLADEAMALMRAHGFDACQVDASQRALTELNIAHDVPALLRSTERRMLQLVGLVDGRRAATDLAPRDRPHLVEAIADLHAEALAAPRDGAHAVSAGQRQRIVQGPIDLDEGACVDVLSTAVDGLLGFRAAHVPTVQLQEGVAAHVQLHCHTLTSEGSELEAGLGWYELGALASAREQGRTSSFNELSGATHRLDETTAAQFGIEAMLRDLARQTEPRRLAERFTGDVVLAPAAVASLLGWLLGQVGDAHLIAGSSVLRDRVGEQIASSALSLHSRFDAPGVLPFSADACLGVWAAEGKSLTTRMPREL
jgi:predicted Zn-dependent protease